MGEATAISWCDNTFNPWVGCTKVSPACDGCYAENLMDTRLGRVEWGAPGKGVGTRARTSPSNWRQPLRWDRKAAKDGTRPFVFCSSLADVFDNQVPTAWRTDLFELIRVTPNLVWLLLTKRPQNIVRLFGAACDMAWPSNAAIGTTVEDQERADLNVPHLLRTKEELEPAFAFLSCEPLLGPIDLRPWLPGCYECAIQCGWRSGTAPCEEKCNWCGWTGEDAGEFCPECARQDFGHVCPDCNSNVVHFHPSTPNIDWVITGGETDQGSHKARPSHPDWFRALRDQCAASGIPFHHKQNGEWQDGSDFAPDAMVMMSDGRLCEFGSAELCEMDRDCQVMPHNPTLIRRVGKSRAGRLLDGIEHNARPEVSL